MSVKINDIKRIAKELKWSVNDEGNVINFAKSGILDIGIGFTIEIELYGVYGEDEDYISMFIINRLHETLINFDNANNIYVYTDCINCEPEIELVNEDRHFIKKSLEILCKKLSFLQWC